MIDHHQPPGIAQVAPASVRGFLAVFHLDAVYGDTFFGGIDIIFLGIFGGDFGDTFLFDIFGGTNGSTISDTPIIFLRLLAGNVFRMIRSVLGDIRRSIIIAFAEVRLLCLLCVYTLRGIIFCAVSQGAAVHPGRQDNTQKKSG